MNLVTRLGNNCCCIGCCNKGKRYPELSEKRSHVEVLKWHKFTTDLVKHPPYF